MRRSLTLAALGASLAGCAHLSLPMLGRAPAAAPAPVQAAPACPGGLAADLVPEPRLPDGASFLNEGAPTTLYLTWLAAYSDWARRGWGRAADARAYCNKAMP